MSESKRLEIFESDYYRMYTNALRLIGLWPFECTYRQRIIRFFIIILLITFTILQGIRLYEEFGQNLDIVLELIGSITFFIGCILKYIVTIQTQSMFQFLYEQIQSHWEIVTNRERRILEQSANDSQFFTKLYMGAAYGALIVYVSTPIIVPNVLDVVIPLNESRAKTFPYFIEYFIDTEVYYYQLMAHGTLCFTISALVYVSIDTMYATCSQHLCSLFDVVEYRLEKASKTDSKMNVNLDLNGNDKNIYKLLNEAIVLHQDSLEFALFIENTYASCFLPVLGLYLTSIVIVAVDIVINLGDMNQIIRLSILYFAFSFHVFFNCVPGQKIHDKSVSIMNSAYFSEWYNLPLEAKKLIQIIIHRSSIPCKFTAGGIVVLNVENFIVIMKSTLSYITLLSSIR
ncbi:odorant receptor 158 [Nasonia vitripennis]|uniref:Odorant receptor n=1 Tax=Nasonia vitripennis TaxID=7425 RepID=A0A7M6UW81_NASVI|nr:odorant receptor 158 [Nasonia vitripennis]